MVILCVLIPPSFSATRIKANNTTNLNVAGSWDVLPGSGDIAQWKNPPLSAANTTVLGGDLSWLGMSILTPGGTVTISAGNTLTLGTSGIDMSSAGNDLAINCNITLGGNQTWNTGGQFLAIGGTVTNTSFINNTLTVSGNGSALFSGAVTGAQAALFSDDFSDNTLGSAWTTFKGAWSENSTVLQQTSGINEDPKKATISNSGTAWPATHCITAKVRVDAWSDGDYARAGVSLFTNTSDGYGYNLLFHNNHSTIQWLDDMVAWGPSYSFSWNTGQWYWFKMKTEGGTLYGKVWADGDPEPGTWPYSWTRSGRSGHPALNGGSGNTVTASFDNVTVTDNGLAVDQVALVKDGAGTLTLSGTNTYTGATTVSGGTLLVTGSTAAGSAVGVGSGSSLGGTGTISGTITLSAGGIVTPGTGGTAIGTLTTANVTMNASSTYSVDLDGVAPSCDQINSSGTVTCAGALTIASYGNAATSQTYIIVNAGTRSGTFAGLADGDQFSAMGRIFQIAYTGTQVTLTDMGPTGMRVWNGGHATLNDWTQGDNWGGAAPLALDALQFAGSTRLFPNNDYANGTGFASITFNAGAGAFTIGGNSIQLNGDLTNASGNLQTVNLAMTFLATHTVTSTGSGSIALGGIISGAGGLTKSGATTLTLTGTNTYTGLTTVSAGTLSIGNGVTDGSIAASSGITDNAALVYNVTGSQTYSNVIGGTGTLTKSGAGTLYLTGTNTYAGITTISGGTLSIGNGATDGSIASSSGIIDNTALIYNVMGSRTYSYIIGGSGTLTKSGAGTLTLSGANTFSGATVVSAGTLKLSGGSDRLPAGTALSIASGATFDINGCAQQVGSLANSGGAGGTVMNAGSSDNTLTVSGSGSTSFSGVIVGQSALFSDDFSDNSLGSAWTTYNGTWSENSTILQQTSGASQDPKKATISNSGNPWPTSVCITAKVRVDAWSDGDLARVGVSLFTNTSDGRGYNLLFHNNHSTVQWLDDNVAWGPSYSFSWSTGQWYWFKMKTDGTTLYGKVWADGDAEPGTWPYSWTRSGRSGHPALNGGSGNGMTASFDNVTVTDEGLTVHKLALTKAGSSTLTLSGANTYNGATTLSAGTLKAGTATQAFGVGSAVTMANAAGTSLDITGYNNSIGSLSGGGTTGGDIILGAATLTAGGDNTTTTYYGTIGGSGGGLVKVGTGTFTLVNTSTYSGGTTITAGTLQIGDGTTDGSVTASSGITDNAALIFNTIGSKSYGVSIGGTGTVTKSGSGTLTLSGTSTYTGTTTVGNGTLIVTGATNSGSAVTVNSGSALGGGTWAVAGTVAGTVTVNNGGLLTPGTGGTTIGILNTGPLTFSATSTYSVDLDGTIPSYDKINSTGAVALGSSALTVASIVNSVNGKAYIIIAGASVTGTFSGMAEASTFAVSGRTLRINYTATQVTLTDVTAGLNPAWSQTSLGQINGGAITENKIFLGATSTNALICRNLSNGSQAWAPYSTSSGCGSPTYSYIAGAYVILAASGNQVVGVTETGSEKWTPKTVGASAGTPYICPDNTNFFITYSGNISKRVVATGNPVAGWTDKAVTNISTTADIVVYSDFVYVATTTNGTVIKADAGDATTVSTYAPASLNSVDITLPLLISGNRLYVTPNNRTLHAVVASTMSTATARVVTYSQTLNSNNTGQAFSDIDMTSDTVYTAADNYVYMVKDDGLASPEKWCYTAGVTVNSGPIVWNGTVYFGTSGPNYYAINKTNGTLRTGWPYSGASGNASTGPWLDLSNNRVLFATTGGNLDAFAMDP